MFLGWAGLHNLRFLGKRPRWAQGHKGSQEVIHLWYSTVLRNSIRPTLTASYYSTVPTSRYSSPLFPIANTNVPYRLCRFVWNGPVATNCQSQFGRENKKFIIFVDLTGSLIHSRPRAVTLSTSQPRPPVSSGLSTTDGRPRRKGKCRQKYVCVLYMQYQPLIMML